MASKFKVLVVDDEQFIRKILSRIIKREGFDVEEACDGQNALDKMEKDQYDFVVSDIKMPNLDGMALLKNIKENYPMTKVLLVTAYSGIYTPTQILNAGADAFIIKPFKNSEISKILKTVALKIPVQV